MKQVAKQDTNLGQVVKASNTLYKTNPDFSANKGQMGAGTQPQVGYNASQGLKKK